MSPLADQTSRIVAEVGKNMNVRNSALEEVPLSVWDNVLCFV